MKDWNRVLAPFVRRSKSTSTHTNLEGIEGPAVAALAFDYEHTLVIGELHTVQHELELIIRTTNRLR